MKLLSLKDFNEINLWINRYARQMELAIWKYYFDSGSKENIINALSYYQNEDGGFGHALEPDSWNLNSSPYATLVAANILEDIDFVDEQHNIVKGILNFLGSFVHCSEYGWHFSIKTNNDYAHAPWWTYNEEANLLEGIGLTAEIAGFLLKYMKKDTQVYKKVIGLTNIVLNKLETLETYGEMGIGGYCKLLNYIKDCDLNDFFDIGYIEKKLKKKVYDSIERDISKWSGYYSRPSKYIKSPKSIFYEENKDIVEKELDYLIEHRVKNEVWDITWSWFENNEKYAKEFAISENWWKASIAIDNVKFLRNFNRLAKK